jgi:hypothetical protein
MKPFALCIFATLIACAPPAQAPTAPRDTRVSGWHSMQRNETLEVSDLIGPDEYAIIASGVKLLNVAAGLHWSVMYERPWTSAVDEPQRRNTINPDYTMWELGTTTCRRNGCSIKLRPFMWLTGFEHEDLYKIVALHELVHAAGGDHTARGLMATPVRIGTQPCLDANVLIQLAVTSNSGKEWCLK